MANTVIGEKREGSARIRSSGGIPTIEETYVFLVRAESKSTSRYSVLATPGLPVVNVTASSYGLTICRTKDAIRREDQPELWDVTCEFSSEVEEGQDGGSGQDPQSDPETWVPVYETKFERLQEVVTKDWAGNAIANSCGVGFPTGLTIGRFIPVWEFYQIEAASVTDEQIIARNEKVNSSTFKGRAAHTLLCTVVSSVRGYYYGAARRLTQYRLAYNDRNWKHKRLDIGQQYLAGGVLEPYEDAKGNQYHGPLNGSGGKVASIGDPPAVLEFEMYEAISFSFLRT